MNPRSASILIEENARLRTILREIAFHAVGKKPKETSPQGNRLQAVYCCCLKALGSNETTAAVHAAEKRGDT